MFYVRHVVGDYERNFVLHWLRKHVDVDHYMERGLGVGSSEMTIDEYETLQPYPDPDHEQQQA